MSDVRVVWTTFGDLDSANRVVRDLVEKQLVACANLIPGATSIYRWQGEVHQEGEVLVFLKTTLEVLDEVMDDLRKHHPYDEPEMIVTEVVGGSEGLLAFVRDSVKSLS